MNAALRSFKGDIYLGYVWDANGLHSTIEVFDVLSYEWGLKSFMSGFIFHAVIQLRQQYT